jgi:hypothetical protein
MRRRLRRYPGCDLHQRRILTRLEISPAETDSTEERHNTTAGSRQPPDGSSAITGKF